MSVNAYTALANLVAAAELDYDKAVGGNKAAVTRVRKAMMAVKTAAQDIRKNILTSAAPAVPGCGTATPKAKK